MAILYDVVAQYHASHRVPVFLGRLVYDGGGLMGRRRHEFHMETAKADKKIRWPRRGNGRHLRAHPTIFPLLAVVWRRKVPGGILLAIRCLTFYD